MKDEYQAFQDEVRAKSDKHARNDAAREARADEIMKDAGIKAGRVCAEIWPGDDDFQGSVADKPRWIDRVDDRVFKFIDPKLPYLVFIGVPLMIAGLIVLWTIVGLMGWIGGTPQ